MSCAQIDHSPDLKRLRSEGFDIDVVSNVLVMKNVPYVAPNKTVKHGMLVSELTLSGDVTRRPGTHVAYFSGEHPCNENGEKMGAIAHGSAQKNWGHGIATQHSFSSKPNANGGYDDYHHKMKTYYAMIAAPAQLVDPDAATKTFPVSPVESRELPFEYIDTASGRAEINAISAKLEMGKVAIVGLGGTGAYVLDLLAKTPIDEIHLFDGDKFSQHNAFRAPGAPSKEVLKAEPLKVEYLADLYANMKRGIHSHPVFIKPDKVSVLLEMDFVFLCIDDGEAKRPMIEALEQAGIKFIDVGMGLEVIDDSLRGTLRVTAGTDENRGDIFQKKRVSFAGGGDDPYSQNIQVADLNCLNAALAVVMWKKMMGFYVDHKKHRHLLYTIFTDGIVGDE